ncbi:uncharacterized acetyltransferase At3g50280-like [Zingiber officinale]|uniref:HXXXD-type acyl-transferase family protein n=1 Tax=Zingiber officinale TaxID=94328 RepID=A0A8J5HIP9_ZINOF|nr:uncharacterized acetyltransferase At3g50280-like [Zingiber officinale]KAG6525551.1 hypothetical protein ZIOFF_015513 [Zingiber officinale]
MTENSEDGEHPDLDMTENSEVRILSNFPVRPSPRPGEEDGGRLIHLTPWDLKMISVDYIQRGLLFLWPPSPDADATLSISRLRDSFAAAVDRFFPLAGRLSVANLSNSPPSLSISLKCNDEGAGFIHASAPSVTVSSILHSLYVPPVVRSFFPLNGALSYDGHCLPLLAVQVTELADGIFIACSLNHAVADGTVFWNFFNSWSQICRSGSCPEVSSPLAVDRWFLDSCNPPIRLPFGSANDFIRRPVYAPVEVCAFHFSAAEVAKLKATVNAEMGTDGQISSLQSLLSFIWVSVTRARRLDPNLETFSAILIGCRTRLTPPLPESYLGNAVHVATTRKVTAGELLQRGLGWAAWQLNQTVASFNDSSVRNYLTDWVATPSFGYAGSKSKSSNLATGSSPRFNVYGNDFGWGRPVGVRSGAGNKADGILTVFPGPEKGSIMMEACLSPETLSALVKDEELMRMVSRN